MYQKYYLVRKTFLVTDKNVKLIQKHAFLQYIASIIYTPIPLYNYMVQNVHKRVVNKAYFYRIRQVMLKSRQLL